MTFYIFRICPKTQMLWVGVLGSGAEWWGDIHNRARPHCKQDPGASANSGRDQDEWRAWCVVLSPDGVLEIWLDLGSWIREIVWKSLTVDPMFKFIWVRSWPFWQSLTKTPAELEISFLMSPEETVSVIDMTGLVLPHTYFCFWSFMFLILWG